MQPKPRRPTGVTILGILSILAGLGGITVGAGGLALSGLAASAYPGGATVAAGLVALLFIFAGLVGVFSVGLFCGGSCACSLIIIDPVHSTVFRTLCYCFLCL